MKDSDERPLPRLMIAGLVFRPCRTCRTPIGFAETKSGKKMPVEKDGTPHWGRCPGAKDWSGKKR